MRKVHLSRMAQQLPLIAHYGSLKANDLFLRFGRLTLFLFASRRERETRIILKEKFHNHKYRKLSLNHKYGKLSLKNETQFFFLLYLFTADNIFVIITHLFFSKKTETSDLKSFIYMPFYVYLYLWSKWFSIILISIRYKVYFSINKIMSELKLSNQHLGEFSGVFHKGLTASKKQPNFSYKQPSC